MVTYTMRKTLAEEVDCVFLTLSLTVLSIKSKYFKGEELDQCSRVVLQQTG